MIHWANATHACTCEVDIETGHVTLTRYIVSEDVGPMINPNVVEGQVAGGTVQGIGGALLENLAYDDDGNPLSSTFVDYLLPTATEVPPIEFGHVEIPGPGVGGYKGAAKAAPSAPHPRSSTPINDALAPLGVTVTQLPASPRRPSSSSSRRLEGRTTNVELNNEFRVAVPAAKAWEVLTDVERVAPCLPGATLLSVDGDEFNGAVKVKVGPITVSYKGDCDLRGEGRGRAAGGAQGRGQGDPGQRHRRGHRHRAAEGRGRRHHRGHHHRPRHLG